MPEGNGNFRDRIKELRRVKASELLDNPKNWRTHPQTQSRALKSILTEIGYAQALVARELDDGQLVLIDGHLRKDMNPNQDIPVIIVDLDENEADIMLATLDPIGEMATTDNEMMRKLIENIKTEDAESLQKQHPNHVKIVKKWGRFQHSVNYKPFKINKLKLKPDIVIPENNDEYGLYIENPELIKIEHGQTESIGN